MSKMNERINKVLRKLFGFHWIVLAPHCLETKKKNHRIESVKQMIRHIGELSIFHLNPPALALNEDCGTTKSLVTDFPTDSPKVTTSGQVHRATATACHC